MPVQRCSKNKKPGWRWGKHGKCYTYKVGSVSASKRAKAKAGAQGRAAHASGYKG